MKQYFVSAWKDTSAHSRNHLGESGPFESRAAAERFAAGLSSSGQANMVEIKVEETDEEDDS